MILQSGRRVRIQSCRSRNLNSFERRGQNRVAGAKLSDHERANALDISAIKFKNGQLMRPADAAANKGFRIAMRKSVCTRFTTVLGQALTAITRTTSTSTLLSAAAVIVSGHYIFV